MSSEQVILHRDHHFIDDWWEMVGELAKTYPVTRDNVNDIWNQVDTGDSVTFEIVHNPSHVVAVDNKYNLRCHGWNRKLAIESVVRSRLKYDYPPDDVNDIKTFRKQVQTRVDSYSPPRWEQQVLRRDEGEYTNNINLTHLEKTQESIPVEWYGVTDTNEVVYIRYRGGSLRVFVGPPNEQQKLAYFKTVAQFPDSSLSTRDMLVELPRWITYLSNMPQLPDEIHELIGEAQLEMMEESFARLNEETENED